MSKKIRLFHATKSGNVESILEQGLISRWEGVYLTDSIESAQRWMGWRFAAEGESRFAVIEVEVEESRLVEGMDHSPLMHELFGAGRSLVHPESIPREQVMEVHHFAIGA